MTAKKLYESPTLTTKKSESPTLTAKKLYESPTLSEYGDIQELTQGSGSGGFEVDSGGNTWPYKPS